MPAAPSAPIQTSAVVFLWMPACLSCLQLEASQQAGAAEASSLSAQLQEVRAAASAAASKARGDQLVLAKEVKRLREELAAAQQVRWGGE